MTGVTLAAPLRSYGMDRDSELEIVRRVRAGDREAFDIVHGAFNSRLFSFLARVSGNRDVAQDLLEETWLRFVANAKRLEADTRLGPWLFAVARNLHISYCRSRAIEVSHTETGIGLWPVIAQTSPFDHTAGPGVRATAGDRARESSCGVSGGITARWRRGAAPGRGGSRLCDLT